MVLLEQCSVRNVCLLQSQVSFHLGHLHRLKFFTCELECGRQCGHLSCSPTQTFLFSRCQHRPAFAEQKHTPGNMTSQTRADDLAAKEPCFYKEPNNGAEVKNLASYTAVGNCLFGIVPAYWCPSPSGLVCSSAELCREDDGVCAAGGGASSHIVFVDVLQRLLLIASLPMQLCLSDSHTHFMEQHSPVCLTRGEEQESTGSSVCPC